MRPFRMTSVVLLTAFALTLAPGVTAALDLTPLPLDEESISQNEAHVDPLGDSGALVDRITEEPIHDLALQSYAWRPIFGVEEDRERLGICANLAGPTLSEGGEPIDGFIALLSDCPGYGTLDADPTLVCLEASHAPIEWSCPSQADFFIPEGSNVACVPLSLVDPQLAANSELAKFNAQAGIVPPVGTSYRTITGTLRIRPDVGFATVACHYCYAEVSDAGYLNAAPPTGVPAVDDLVADLVSMFDDVAVITNYNGQFSFTVNVGLQGAADGSDPIIEVFARDPSGSSAMFPVTTGIQPYRVDSVDPVRTNCGGATCSLGTIYISTIGTESSTLANEALYVRNQIAEGWAWENSAFPLAGLGDISVKYPIGGHGDGGYYDKPTQTIGLGSGVYRSDTAYHEFGHWFQDNVQSGFPSSTPCTGLHFWNIRSNEVCAFVEGFAHWIGSRADNSNYLDIYVEAVPSGGGSATFITTTVHQGTYSCTSSPSTWCSYIPTVGGSTPMNSMQSGGKCVEGRMSGLLWWWIEYYNHQDTDLLYILHGASYTNMNTFTELDNYVNTYYSGTVKSHFNNAESLAFSSSVC